MKKIIVIFVALLSSIFHTFLKHPIGSIIVLLFLVSTSVACYAHNPRAVGMEVETHFWIGLTSMVSMGPAAMSFAYIVEYDGLYEVGSIGKEGGTPSFFLFKLPLSALPLPAGRRQAAQPLFSKSAYR